MTAKKLLSAIIAATMIFSFAVTASAEAASVQDYGISPYYMYATNTSSLLSVSGTTASCESKASGLPSVTKIVVVQTLERHWAFGLFFGVDGASWTKTVNSNSATAINKKYNLGSGTYRLKTEFTLYSGTQSETITAYSPEKTIS